MSKRVYAFEEACVGCRLCELACIQEHTGAADLWQVYEPSDRSVLVAPRLHVEEAPAGSATSPSSVPLIPEVTVAVTCRNCEEPLCLFSCLTGALYRDERGVVRLHEESCVGCWTCVLACPWGAIRPTQQHGRPVSGKCDLCPDRPGGPACVAACPNGALAWAEEPPVSWRRLRELLMEVSPRD